MQLFVPLHHLQQRSLSMQIQSKRPIHIFWIWIISYGLFKYYGITYGGGQSISIDYNFQGGRVKPKYYSIILFEEGGFPKMITGMSAMK